MLACFNGEEVRLNAMDCADQHLKLQIIKQLNMLNVAQAMYGTPVRGIPVVKVHTPTQQWLCSSFHNYEFTVTQLEELFKEYSYRYEKAHQLYHPFCKLKRPPQFIPSLVRFSIPPHTLDYTSLTNEEAWKLYYWTFSDKFSWTNVGYPKWLPLERE